MRRPGVDREATLLPHPPDVVSVKDHKRQAEALVQFFLPLQQDRRGRRDDDPADALAHEKLAHDEASLDRLAQTHIVRNEQVHARQE